MFGGLKKTTSRLAIMSAAGFFVSGFVATFAQAADLGGDCCADLEERVSELEATTVRKGNRKVSLKLSGHVNRMIVYWDDQINDDVYFLDNSESETRFRLTGDAPIAPGWKAGFKIEVEVVDAEGSTVDQLVDDRTPDGANDGDDNSDGAINARKMSWFIKNDQLGKITIGRDSPATDDVNQLNIAKNPIADADFDNMRDFHLAVSQGMFGCTGAACRTSVNLDTIMANVDTRRANGIRFDSPSLFGMVISAFYGEDDLADIAIRYKKEWNSIRFVGGIGYVWDTDEDPDRTIQCPQPGLGNGQNTGNCVDERIDRERLVGSASVMHVPTGIYLYAAASNDKFGNFHNSSNGAAPQFFSPVNGRAAAPDATSWYVQAGIKRRLLAPNLGKTTLYAEYGRWNDFGVGLNAAALGGPSGLFTRASSEITDSSADLWGFGNGQNTGNCVDERIDRERLVGSASVMHVPTGIYLYAAASNDKFGNFHNSSNGAAPQFFSPVNGRAAAPDATSWYVQAGIKRRLLAPNLGKTTLYAEYGRWNDFGVGLNAAALGGPSGLFTRASSEITDSSADLWGFGIVQAIDPAAMELYLGARMHQTDVRIATSGPAPLPNNQPAGAKFSTEDLFTVSAGAKIKF